MDHLKIWLKGALYKKFLKKKNMYKKVIRHNKIMQVVRDIESAIKTRTQASILSNKFPTWISAFEDLVIEGSNPELKVITMKGFLDLVRSTFFFKPTLPDFAINESRLTTICQLSCYASNLTRFVKLLDEILDQNLPLLPYYRYYYRIYCKISCRDMIIPMKNAALKKLELCKERLSTEYYAIARTEQSLQKAVTAIRKANLNREFAKNVKKIPNRKIINCGEYGLRKPIPQNMSVDLKKVMETSINYE